MSKKDVHNGGGGFFEGLIHDLELFGIVQASKDKNGRFDPYKAAGMAAGLGHTSWADIAYMGSIIGAEDGFERDNLCSDWESNTEDYSWRTVCDVDFEHGINPEDYETEEEYMEAVEEEESQEFYFFECDDE